MRSRRSMNEIHARFWIAHAPPRSRPDGPVRGQRLGHEPLGLHEIAAEEMRHAELAQHVGAARVVADLAPAARARRRRSARRRRTRRPRSRPRRAASAPRPAGAARRLRSPRASTVSRSSRGGVDAALLHGRLAASEQRAPAVRARLGRQQAERAVVVAAEHHPRLHELGAVGGAAERVDRLLANVGGHAGHGAELGHELGRGREVVRDRVDRRRRRASSSTGATRAWRRARSALVSVPYAISWMRSDLKWNSSSSSSTRSRSASRSRSVGARRGGRRGRAPRRPGRWRPRPRSLRAAIARPGRARRDAPRAGRAASPAPRGRSRCRPTPA